jgi:diguanylate cyclase (GGDEF)-like protein/PAS domain S-box-containing protein
MDNDRRAQEVNPTDYGAIFNAVNDAIFVHDIDTGAILDVNNRACEMYCYSREELLGSGVGRISADIEPYRQEDAARYINKAAEGEPQVFEWMAKDKAERFFWVEVSLRRAVIGGKYRVLAIVRDISYRKEDEAVLRLAEFSLESSSDYIFWTNKDGRILYANDAGCISLGYSRDELLGMSVPDIVPSFGNGAWTRHWDEMKMNKHILQQNSMKRKDGSVFPVEVGVNYLEFENDEYICAFVRDITERKRIEGRLKSINDAFLSFGSDSVWNINCLTRLCGELLGADCAIYSCIEGENISACGRWNTPADFKTFDNAKGHICSDVVAKGGQEAVVINNLPDTEYLHTDPNVAKYGLKTYIGKAVVFEGRYKGSVCVVYKRDFFPTDEDRNIISIVASAIGVEENRKSIECTMAEDEKFLSEIFLSIQDGISVLDKDMKILRVNPTMENWYGHAMPLAGKKCYEAYHGRSSPCKVCPTARTLETGKSAYEIVPRTGSRGETIGSMELYSFPLMDFNTGKLKGVIEYVRDISEKRSAEESLTKRDYQLEILSRTSQHVNAVLETNTVLRTLAAAAMELVDAGVGAAGLTSNGTINFLEVNNMGKIEHRGYSVGTNHGAAGWGDGILKPYFSNDESHAKNMAPALNDIAPIYNIINVPVINSRGVVLGCFEIANKRNRLPFDSQDVFMLQGLAASAAVALENVRLLENERVLTEKLSQEVEQVQTYLNTAGVIIVAIGADQKVALVNKKGCEILGYDKDEIIGKNWFDMFVPEPMREDVRTAFVKLMAGKIKAVEYYENSIMTKKSGERIIEWHNSVLRDGTGKITATLSSGLDITEKRRLSESQARLRDEVNRSYKRLKKLSMKDSETGLYNHHYLSDIIEGEYYRAKRYAHPLSVIMLDIDYFKSINDVYGHEFGDLVLKQLAKCLRRMVRKYDTVVRYGGEEFAVVSSIVDRSKAVALAQRILDAVNLNNFGNSKHVVKLKLSIGVISYPGDAAISGRDLIRTAEKILNKAKEAGGNRVYSSVEVKNSKRGKAAYVESEDISILKDRLEKLTQKGNQSIVESIFAFAKTLDMRDHYTGEHTEHTVHYSTGIAKALGLSSEEVDNIKQASILHDLGKVGVSDKILHKKGKLTKREFEEIKKHPQIAADIIRPVQFLHDIIPLILHHHERWDGKGYPSGLVGPEIPLGARIISVADVYQALTSVRPYRNAFSQKDALDIIKKGSGTHFDPHIVSVFFNIIEKEKNRDRRIHKKKGSR